MADKRKKRFTADEVIESIFTEGSGDEEDDEGNEEENERRSDIDLFDDMPVDLNVTNEAASSESSSANESSFELEVNLDLDSTRQSRTTSDPRTSQTVDNESTESRSSSNEEEGEDMYRVETKKNDELQEEVTGEVENEEEIIESEDDEVQNEWVRNMNNFPRIPPFTGTPGLKVQLPDDALAFDVYQLIITHDLKNSWKIETNRYARDVIQTKNVQQLAIRSRFRKWKPVTLYEIRKFIAICLHMGIMKKPTLHDYWTRHPAMHSSFCAKVMPRERFLSILAFFHIENNTTYIPYDQPNHYPLHKIRLFITHLNLKFKEPERDICIDEAMVAFKGRSRFKVYMKDKPTKLGFKLYEMCGSKSGYVYSLEMYFADKRISNKPVDVTMRLLEPLMKQGHRLFIDNYYCCPALWDWLKGKKTMMVGTCRKNRLGMPRDLFERRQRAGDFDYRRKGQLVVNRWTDKREVVTLSSFHQPELQETMGRFERKLKPLAVI